MKVILDEKLFAGHALARSSLHLLSIFRLGLERRHAIVLGFRRTPNSSFEAWLEHRPDYEKNAIEGALRYGRQSDTRDVLDNVIRVTPDPEPQWSHNPPHLPTHTATELLAKPLELLVEDAVSDQEFLRAVAVGSQTDDFLRFIENKWIRFVNGGGVPNMSRQVESQKDHPEFRRRTWVIFDSDALAPELPPHRKSQELMDLCITNAIYHHCLWRRAMENYLPPEFLMESLRGKPQEHAAEAFQRLSIPGQRHHYNMKLGFNGDRARLNESDTRTQEIVTGLFDGLSLSDKTLLENGFGRSVGELFKAENGNRPLGLTEDILMRDGVGEELSHLLSGIMAWV